MSITLPKPLYMIGSAYALWAPLGTTEPSSTVSGGVFTDSWPAGWNLFGATDDGNVFSYQVTVNPVEAAEFLLPVGQETESAAGKLTLSMISIVASNLAVALNGGSKTTTGSGSTLKTVVQPPDPGNEARYMIGLESRDSKVRYIVRQALNGAEIAINHGKGAGNKSKIPMEWNFEYPDSGLKPFDVIYAGTRAV